MTTHTQGAWVYGDWVNAKVGAIDDCKWVEIWAPNGHDNGLPFIACKHHDQLANARLIAAAPELLAALRKLTDEAWPYLTAVQREEATAVIAKAEGGEQ